MSSLDKQLPQSLDQRILYLAERIVPPNDRADWLRAWHAELWHMHHRSEQHHARNCERTMDLSAGIVRDALWLRAESWRCALSGSASLCLASLFALSLFLIAFVVVFDGSWSVVSPHLFRHFRRSLFAAPFVVSVAFATGSKRYVEQSLMIEPWIKLKRHSFFVLKTAEVLLLAFLLSADSIEIVRGPLSGLTPLLQLLMFVSFALLGLRWTFTDQEQRCKHCLTSLESPARVGRPSHNLLEWNGTELSCRRGHGLLSIPEIETSWCETSRWIVSKPEVTGKILE